MCQSEQTMPAQSSQTIHPRFLSWGWLRGLFSFSPWHSSTSTLPKRPPAKETIAQQVILIWRAKPWLITEQTISSMKIYHLLFVCIAYMVIIKFLFQIFVRLENIRKCYTQKKGIFVLEEFSKNIYINKLKLVWLTFNICAFINIYEYLFILRYSYSENYSPSVWILHGKQLINTINLAQSLN